MLFLPIALIISAASIPYLNSLEGRYVYDDKVAVSGNPDVYRTNVSLSTLLVHDFWGNDLFPEGGHGWTHHSWRPIVVLTFRADWSLGGGSVLPFHVTNIILHALACIAAYIAYVSILAPPSASVSLESVMALIGLGRRKRGAAAAAASPPYAFVAALLYALHPIHTECVSNITSRADSAAAIFQLLALALYAEGVVLPWRPTNTVLGCSACCAEARDTKRRGSRASQGCKSCLWTSCCALTGESLRAFGVFSLILIGLACKETSLIIPALCACVDIAAAIARAAIYVDSRDGSGKGEGGDSDDAGAGVGGEGTGFIAEDEGEGSLLASPKKQNHAAASGSTMSSSTKLLRQLMSGKRGGGKNSSNTGSSSKGGGEEKEEREEADEDAADSSDEGGKKGVRFVLNTEEALSAAPSSIAAASLKAGPSPRCSNCPLLLRLLYRLFFTELPILKIVAYLAISFAIYYVRIVIMARGYDLQSWANPIHNTLYHMSWGLEKILAVAFVQSFALSKLILPIFLSHEHNALQHVRTLSDPRNLLTFVAYGTVAGLIILALRQVILSAADAAAAAATTTTMTTVTPTTAVATNRRENRPKDDVTMMMRTHSSASSPNSSPRVNASQALTAPLHRQSEVEVLEEKYKDISAAYRLLYGLAFVGVSYFPSSHFVQYVAFILAERTLFLTSFGSAIVLAEFLTTAAGDAVADSPPSPAAATSSLSLQQPSSISANVPTFDASKEGRSPLASPKPSPSPPSSRFSASSMTPWRLPFAPLIFVALTIAYLARTLTRNMEWANEEVLMASNLALYPENNTMTVYGLGAVALYKGELKISEAYLKKAIAESTMVEPRILLSQLYWKHYPTDIIEGTNKTGYQVAQEELQYVSMTSSPRKEVLTNLGMLQYRQADRNDSKALYTAEHNILAAHLAHGYPAEHHSIALLASNAGCIRLMSPPDPSRFGSPELAETLLNEALKVAREGGTPAAFRNAATFYAIQGYPWHALSIVEEGAGLVTKSLTQVLSSEDPTWPGSKLQMAQYFYELLLAFQRMNVSINVNLPKILIWAHEPPLAGPRVEKRMSLLGLECYLELLWW